MSSIDVPEDVLLIDAAALRERDIPSGVVHVRLASDVSELPNMAFKGCSSLKSVEFNEGLVRIGGVSAREPYFLRVPGLTGVLNQFRLCFRIVHITTINQSSRKPSYYRPWRLYGLLQVG